MFLTSLLCIILTAINASAYDFEVDGIYYNKLSDTECGVTVPGWSESSVNTYYFGNVKIPSSVTYNNSVYTVSEIENHAFYRCKELTGVDIPNTVTTIGDRAFADCSSLTSVEIPNSVTAIGVGAFWDCSSLKKIAYPLNLNINDLPTDCKRIAYPTDGVIDSDGVIFSADKSNLFFAPIEIKAYVVPNSVTTIDDWAFVYCSSLASVEIPNSVTTIGDGAFNNCSSLASVEIPNSVTTIGDGAFNNCSSLASVEIPNSVTTIGGGAFCGCESLKMLTIGENVRTIYASAFMSCPKLIEINSKNCRNPLIKEYEGSTAAFDEIVYHNAKLFVPEESVQLYMVANDWEKFDQIEGKQFGGVGTVVADSKVVVEGNTLVVDGADGVIVEVYNTAGQLVYKGEEKRIMLPKDGLYLVKIGNQTVKVVM